MTSSSSFDDKIVRKLAKILNETHLSEIEYEIGEIRVKVVRQLPASIINAGVLPNVIPHTSLPASTPVSSSLSSEVIGSPNNQKTVDWAQHPGVIKAPMVGTAYSSANPAAQPFIQVGSEVKKGQTLLIIEAMKVMNQIRSPKDGKVVEVLFHDGEPVEYDHPLLIIE
jgi:acetyl-CoA carboxylase biotin carboxyl carrier protein